MTYTGFRFIPDNLSSLGRAVRRRVALPFLRNAYFILVLALAWLVPAIGKGEVRAVTANPAEDCSTGVNIGWHADLDETSCSLVYTKKDDTDWADAKTVPGKSQPVDVFDGIFSKTPDGKDWHEEAKFLDYGVTLTGLEPDTEYMYKVDCGKGAEGGGQGVGYFKTAGASEFSFVWISDAHAYTPLPNRLKSLTTVFEEAIKIQPSVDFVFSTGDMVAWGGSYSFWRKLLEQPFVSNYLFADVIGNHDWMMRGSGGRDDFFRVAYNKPTNGYPGQEGVCYWFIYGDVLFLTFNNEQMRRSDEAVAAAKAWAAGVIGNQKGRYKRIIIAQHYQWFDGRNGRSNWYDNWKDFCDEHNVTLALSGNNHVYQRTHVLRNDEVVEEGQGTVYMVAPSSDGERGTKAGPLTANADKLAYTYSSQVVSGDNHVKTIGCVLVDVGPGSITTRLVYIDENKQPQVADEHTIKTQPADAPRQAVASE